VKYSPFFKFKIMIQVTFKVKSCFGAKGEVRTVSERAAMQFFAKGLIEPFKEEVKEEKIEPETKEEKQELETKEVKGKKAKITKAPKL
jgi:hypothetical protein